jgi:hypothetical protein
MSVLSPFLPLNVITNNLISESASNTNQFVVSVLIHNEILSRCAKLHTVENELVLVGSS